MVRTFFWHSEPVVAKKHKLNGSGGGNNVTKAKWVSIVRSVIKSICGGVEVPESVKSELMTLGKAGKGLGKQVPCLIKNETTDIIETSKYTGVKRVLVASVLDRVTGFI